MFKYVEKIRIEDGLVVRRRGVSKYRDSYVTKIKNCFAYRINELLYTVRITNSAFELTEIKNELPECRAESHIFERGPQYYLNKLSQKIN